MPICDFFSSATCHGLVGPFSELGSIPSRGWCESLLVSSFNLSLLRGLSLWRLVHASWLGMHLLSIDLLLNTL